MAVSKKTLENNLRIKYIESISEYLTNKGEEVLITGSNEIAIPCLDEESNEKFLVITFKIPSGSRDGDAYDGYSMASYYADKVAEKKEKARLAAEKKAKKIAADKARRATKKKGE